MLRAICFFPDLGHRERAVAQWAALLDTLKGSVPRTGAIRARDDLRPRHPDATSGRDCIFVEADGSHLLVVRVLHDRMDYRRHFSTSGAPDEDA